MSNLFIERAVLQTKILTGSQSHQYNNECLILTEIIGEDQKKGLHQFRRPFFTDNIDEAHKD